ncbi:hypothetical protein [Spirillospora sp. CA-294931]|uniref:hypothetical protein n=1 Tax=Spirillospora sp. CA-294931 TaxID=3240042 RepID=UPI003D8FFB64
MGELQESQIDATLQDLVAPPGADGDAEHPEHITHGRLLNGGRSTATVLEVEIQRAGRPTRSIAKIDEIGRIAAEWRAFKEHIAPRPRALFTPIEYVSETVLMAGQEKDLGDGYAAIVYQHVANYSATGDPNTDCLEDLIEAALQGEVPKDNVVSALRMLMQRLWNGLYEGSTPSSDPTNLWKYNTRMGVDLVLEVNHASGVRLRFDPARADDIPEWHRMEVLEASISPAGAEDLPGKQISLKNALVRLHKDRLLCTGPQWDGVTVHIVAADDSKLDLAAYDGHRVTVTGRVKWLRAADRAQMIRRQLPNIEAAGATVRIGDCAMAHPFTMLESLFREQRRRVNATVVHGDLNPRNVMYSGGQFYLIDFALTRAEQPIFTDPAWLEIGLHRDVIAPRLTWPQTLRLQRLLALASRAMDASNIPQSSQEPSRTAIDELLENEPEIVRTSFEILNAIRSSVRVWYPRQDAPVPWWRDYLTQVSIAACHTLAWSDARQSEPRVRAAVATAAVAAEWLRDDCSYEHWRDEEITAVLAMREHTLRHSDPEALATFAELLAALDSRPGIDDEALAGKLEDARASMVHSCYQDAAREIRDHLREDSHHYIPLSVGAGSEAVRTLAQAPAAILSGRIGSGKSAAIRELAFQLVNAVLTPRAARTVKEADHDSGLRPRMPLLVKARDLLPLADNEDRPRTLLAGLEDRVAAPYRRVLAGPEPADAFTIGAVHLMVDEFDVLSHEDRDRLCGWLGRLRKAFPRTPILVCDRPSGRAPAMPDAVPLTLRPLLLSQARHHLSGQLTAARIRDEDQRKALRFLTDLDEYAKICDLITVPLFLMAFTRHCARGQPFGGIGEVFSTFVESQMTQTHRESAPPCRFTLGERLRALEVIGRHAVEKGDLTAIEPSVVLDLLGKADVTHPDEVLAELVAEEMLTWTAPQGRRTLAFAAPSFGEYFAARALEHDFNQRVDDFNERALRFEWQQPLRILLSYSDNRQALVEALVDLALKTGDPLFPAQLLRASGDPPAAVVERFLHSQRGVLSSPLTGEHDWDAAAHALAQYGKEDAWQVLRDCVADTRAPERARSLSLSALVGLLRQAGDGTEAGRLRQTVTETLDGLLDAAVPERLRTQAIEAIGDLDVRWHTGRVFMLIDANESWPVVDAAYTALDRLGNNPGPLREDYLDACVARLTAVENELLRSIARDGIDDLQAERCRLLVTCAEAGLLEVLLARRFSYGISHDFDWHTYLAVAAAHPRAIEEASSAVAVLTGGRTTEELLERFTDGDDVTVTAAAHQLLIEGDDVRARELLGRVTADSSRVRLQAVAYAVGSLLDGFEDVTRLVDDLLAKLDAERLGVLASLLANLPQNSLDTKRLFVLTEVRNIDAGLDASVYWPWFHSWANAGKPTAADLQTLFLEGDTGAELAMCWLATFDYLDAGATIPVARPSPEAASILLAMRPDPADTRRSIWWVLACTAAGLTEALDYAFELAERAQQAALPEALVSNSRYGQLETSGVEGVLSCIGHLGLMLREDQEDRCADAYKFLIRYDTGRLHASAERGRLVGLAVLGDWFTILSNLDADDLPLLQAARNAVERWTPGPHTPEWAREHQPIAAWVSAQIEATVDRSPQVRSTLCEIKELLELKLRMYVVSEPRPQS